MKILLAFLVLGLAAFAIPRAEAAVNLQTCTVTPGAPLPTSLLGCPPPNVSFAAVAPTTLVRSSVSGQQGWRAFSTLKPADLVVSGIDGGWHPLSTLTVALLMTPTPPVVTPPPVTPPVVPPAQSQSVTITSTDAPQMSVKLTGLPVPACFTIGTKTVCTP